MNRTLPELVAIATLGLALVGCQHSATTTELAVANPAAPVYTGNIRTINVPGQTVTVKLLLGQKTFTLAPECEIVTADSPRSHLKDLRVGDAVDVAYTEGDGLPVAHRIAVKGVTRDEKEAARDRERLEEILTPSPAERPSH